MKLSIFVVTYNQEQYIQQALDSILMQKVNFDYEVIIGEDCSTDSTPQICEEYASLYPNIKVYHHNPNKGLVKNWEFVLNHCQGEYVAMLEGDDYWLDEHKLQTQVDYLDTHPECVLTFTSADVRYEGGDVRDEHLFSHLEQREYSLREVYEKWSVLSSTVVFRNCPALPIHYPQSIYINDTYTFLHILQYGTAYCINEEWTAYRRHAGNLSRKDSREDSVRWMNQHRLMGKEFPELKDVAERMESLYLKALLYDKRDKNTFRYRVRYMQLNKGLWFSRFAFATLKYLRMK